MKIYKRIFSAILVLILLLQLTSAVFAQTIVYNGVEYSKTDERWNIDFSDAAVAEHKWGVPYVQIVSASTNMPLAAGNDTLTAHTGSAQNSITVEQTNTTHGAALKMTENDDTKVQLNEFLASVAGDLIIYELDYMLQSLPESGDVSFEEVMSPVLDGYKWITPLGFKRDSSGMYFCVGNQRYNATLNTWYSLKGCADLINGTVTYYINGIHFAEGSFTPGAVKGQKIVSGIHSAPGTTVFVDNFNVSALRRSDSIGARLCDVEYTVNGEKTSVFQAGEYTVIPTVTNDGDSRGILCITVVFEGDKMSKVILERHTFDVGETQWKPDAFEIGQVENKDTVKTFLIDDNTLEALDEPRVIKKYNAYIGDNNCCESDSDIKSFLSDKVSYHAASGVTYANGEKRIFKPLIKDEILYVPDSFEDFAFGETTNTPTVSIDGTSYIPLKECVENSENKCFQEVSTDINPGLIVISENEADLSEVNKNKLNNFALYIRPDTEKIADDYDASLLKDVHPRVMATNSDFSRIRNLAKTKATVASWVKSLRAKADALVADDVPLVYELRDGVRLWFVSLDFMDNMSTLGMAYQLTGDKKYAQRAWIDMESVAKFPGWHPEHHIDVGGLAVGYAIGYDWMYNAFSEEQREVIEDGAYNNGFMCYIDGYQGRSSDMAGGIINTANHNNVMNTGAELLGIAFMDVFPKESAYCISEAVRCVEYAICGWAPEGSWFEGMGYGAMTLEYLSQQLAALYTVFGNVYTLDSTQGLSDIAAYFMKMQSPQGSFPFGDGSNAGYTYDPGALWLCDYFGDYDIISAQMSLYGFSASARTLLWYKEEMFNNTAVNLPLDNVFQDQQVITMRDSWDKGTQKTFAGLKGGRPNTPHGYMDVGKFEFFSDGVQWTQHIGADANDYNMPGFWGSGGIDGQRWQYFRTRGESKATLIINPDTNAEFDPAVCASFIRTESAADAALAILDTTASHYGKADSVRRGVFFADNRRSLVVRDEITTNRQTKIYWSMQTSQTAEKVGDNKVMLYSKDNPQKSLTIEFLSNQSFTLSVGACTSLLTSPKPVGMAVDTDKTQIRLEINAPTDAAVNITAKLTPDTVANAKDISFFDIPMEAWTVN